MRLRLARAAQGRPLNDWLVEELNRRGHLGAYAANTPQVELATQVSVEELIVALAMPHAEADGRNWKLIIRALQKGPIDLDKLARMARQERAEGLLAWLVQGVPAVESTPDLAALALRLRPRDKRPPNTRYDFNRLVRSAATREARWRRPLS